MQLRNSLTRYGAVARTLHWIVAALIVTLLIVGWTMGDIEDSDTKFQVYVLHKSTGLLVLALVICRLAWRLFDGPPPPPPGVPKLLHLAAQFGHWSLYAAMLAMPLSGWVLNSAANRPLLWYNIPGFAVPNIVGPDKALREQAGEVHEIIAYIIVALVAGHILAALYHHFIRKDATLARMVPFVKEPKA